MATSVFMEREKATTIPCQKSVPSAKPPRYARLDTQFCYKLLIL